MAGCSPVVSRGNGASFRVLHGQHFKTEGAEPFEPVPYLYYVDPVEGLDKLGKPIMPDIFVDISSVMDTKEEMLCCHESQRNWLLTHHGMRIE